ncbi:hypothetical protein EWI61_03120 [Methylolobus aquaticus]|nr:hypothetical protein EWI61_03120 [Methylolobus aquaticus]
MSESRLQHNDPCGTAAWYRGVTRGIARFFAMSVLMVLSGPIPAVDLGDWAQRVQQYERWTAVEFRDPYSGQYLASRAGSEDPRARATLTLTANPGEDCLPEVVIVIEHDAAILGRIDQADTLRWRVDGGATTAMPIRRIREPGDRFEFLRFERPFDLAGLAGHRRLLIRVAPDVRAEFSLRGFDGAWHAARSVCENFVPLAE